MDFVLSEEQEMIRRMASDFATKELAPIAAEMDEKEEIPGTIIRKLGELGFLGLMVPEEYGGCRLDVVSYILAVEEISKACASTGILMSVHNSLTCAAIEKYGSEEQKRKYLPQLAGGEIIGCFALTEPGAGCDAAAQKTTAVLDGDDYIINGSKHFITNGGIAGLVVLFAMTDKAKGHRGITAFLVETGTPGFEVGKAEDKMGIRATSTCEFFFRDCRVPVANRLKSEGDGFRVAMSILDGGRVGVAAQAVGIATAAYEAALEYAKVREQFGKPLGRFQAIQWMLADMATRIDAARLLTYRAAFAEEQASNTGARFSKEAAMAKLYASETAVWATNKAIQIHGGYGYMKEYAVERHYRDAKITDIYEGTSEVQRMVIAGSILR